MKRKAITCLFFALSIFVYGQRKQPVDYVNMLLGTWGGTGGVIPGVSRPFGMTQFSPQTRFPRIGNPCYQYEDTAYINAFRSTHQPTVWMGDYGYASLMPGIGKVKTTGDSRKLRYSHSKEVATPYYYAADLWNEKNEIIKAEVTASSRCGYMRFTFPQTEDAYFLVEAVKADYPNVTVREEKDGKDDFVYKQGKGFYGTIEILPDKQEIIGFNNDVFSHTISPELKNFKGYFVMQFNKPFKTYGTWSDSILNPNSRKEKGVFTGAYFTFKTEANEVVEVKIGTSFISIEEARKSIHWEIGTRSFDYMKKEGRDYWNNALSKIKIESENEEQKTLFYTFMFHAQQYPREIHEGKMHYSAAFDKVKPGKGYTDFSLWDTYRAEHPLLLYIAPERVNDMIKGMLEHFDGTGRLPIWPNPMETNIMIGSHADPVIADAYIKGFKGYDVQKAYQAIKKDGTIPPPNDDNNPWGDRDPWTTPEGRGGLKHYLEKGYVAIDKTKEAPARTLEYAYDDYCIAQMAKALGFKEDYEMFMKQSKNYKNTFDPEQGYFMARRSDGSFSKDTTEGFTEGVHWMYAFWAPHDIPGMIELYGGREKFTEKLDLYYKVQGYKPHGNEQVHHYPFLYNYVGKPEKTQEAIINTLKTYKNTPWGIGNDDCGQMSAWYVFNTIGFYPVCPSDETYVIGRPMVKKAVIKLNNFYKKGDFTMIAENFSEENIYIQSATLNGKPLENPYIKHAEIINGGTLKFVMGNTPGTIWK